MQTFRFESVVELSNAIWTVTTLPSDVSNSTVADASKSPELVDSCDPLATLVERGVMDDVNPPQPVEDPPEYVGGTRGREREDDRLAPRATPCVDRQ